MKLPLISVVSFFLAVVLFAACTKTTDEPDNNNNTNNNTPASATKQLLVAGKWQIKDAIAKFKHNGKDTTVNAFHEIDVCERDNIIEFTNDNKVSDDEGSNKCPNHSQVETFTYALLDNDTKIAIYDSNPDTFVLEVSNTEMKLSIDGVNSSNIAFTGTQIFKNIN